MRLKDIMLKSPATLPTPHISGRILLRQNMYNSLKIIWFSNPPVCLDISHIKKHRGDLEDMVWDTIHKSRFDLNEWFKMSDVKEILRLRTKVISAAMVRLKDKGYLDSRSKKSYIDYRIKI